jgi:hypothetical protein
VTAPGSVMIWGGETPLKSAMPLTSKEKQEAFRAKREMLGLTEVRGIFLPPELHAKLKAEAQKMLKAAQAASKKI